MLLIHPAHRQSSKTVPAKMSKTAMEGLLAFRMCGTDAIPYRPETDETRPGTEFGEPTYTSSFIRNCG